MIETFGLSRPKEEKIMHRIMYYEPCRRLTFLFLIEIFQDLCLGSGHRRHGFPFDTALESPNEDLSNEALSHFSLLRFKSYAGEFS